MTTTIDRNQTYYAPLIKIHIKGKGHRKFLLHTGSMSSIISFDLLNESDTLFRTGVNVSAANSEKLQVQGVTNQSIRLPGTHKFQEALFVVVNHDWKVYDGIIGNDILLRNKAVIDMHHQKVTHKDGEAQLEMIERTIKDLFMTELSISNEGIPPEEIDTILVQCLQGQSIPGQSTKIVRFKTTRELGPKDRCLLLPNECIQENGCWSPACIVEVNKNGEFLVEVSNLTDQDLVMPETVVRAEIIPFPEANTLEFNWTGIQQDQINPDEDPKRQERFRKVIDRIAGEAKCNNSAKRKLKNLLLSFPDVLAFKDEAIGTSKLFKQDIPLTTEKAIRVPQYPIPKKLRDPLNEWVKEMLKYGVIRPSRSPYNSPCLMVRKKNGEWRAVVDFRKLNLYLAHDPYALPKINELLTSLGPIGKDTFFTALDLLWGFFHIELHERDKQKTAFTTPMGRFEYNRMPMGMKTAPAAFQRLVDIAIMQEMPYPTACYINDILLASPGEEHHLRHLQLLLRRLRETGLKLKVEKCEFFQTEVTFLGHKLTRQGIKACNDKIEKIKNFPVPTTVRELRSFLGLASYYRKFILDFSRIVKVLTNALKEGQFKWGVAEQAAFEKIKQLLAEAPTLAYPQENLPYIITVGYTDSTISAILSQKSDRGEKPLNFVSRVLQGAELNYGKDGKTEELEMLAITYALKQFFPDIYNNQIIVRGQEKVINVLSKSTTKTTKTSDV